MRRLLIETSHAEMTAVNASAVTVELHDRYRLSPQVSLRPEPFGALAYHFGNRRLSFLRHPDMVRLVEGLTGPTVEDVLRTLEIDERRWPSFLTGLRTLVASDMLVKVEDP